MKKPPFTAKESIERKRARGEKLRQETEKALKTADPRVRSAYRSCVEKINAVSKYPSHTPEPFCKTTIYKSRNGRLTRTEIALVHDLLQKHGWDVRLATTLERKVGAKPIELIYCHHHRSFRAKE